ncbi:hypothetical protein ES705_14160 [subsurface metagenome]
MGKNKNDLIPASTRTETALDMAAFVGSVIPWIGGPVSNVLSGISAGRKFTRIREVLEGLVEDLKEFKSKVSEEYVKTEDFEDLLEQTLKRAAEERIDEKRRIYRKFLIDAIEFPGEQYDEQLRFLRSFEKLQLDHLKIIHALSKEPDPNPNMTGSPKKTLRNRLPDMPENRIEELINQLNDMRLTNLTSLKVMMKGRGAENLRHFVTPYGQRFLKYITEA